MIAIQALQGTLEQTQGLLKELFKEGLMAYYCGHGPYRLRFLPPMMALEKNHIDECVQILEQVVLSKA